MSSILSVVTVIIGKMVRCHKQCKLTLRIQNIYDKIKRQYSMCSRVFDSYIKEKSSQAASGLDFFVNLIVTLYSIIWYHIDISYIEVVL